MQDSTTENKNKPDRRTAKPVDIRQGPPDRRRRQGQFDYPKAEPIDPGIHAAFIKAELSRHGYSQVRVAKELELSPVTINKIISGICKSRRVAEFIADKTGLTLDQMWPGKYTENFEDATEQD